MYATEIFVLVKNITSNEFFYFPLAAAITDKFVVIKRALNWPIALLFITYTA